VALPESAPPSRPPAGAEARDLSDAEFAELDGLLADVPEPLEPLDVVMLDGFLAAIVVQPELIDAARWLPYVFDAGGHRWGEAALSPEQLRARALIARRQAAINRSLAEYRSFDPLILEPDEEAAAEAGVESALDATTRAILPWVAGFEFAASIFPGLDDVADDAVGTTLARLYRFLPAEAEDERATAAIVAAQRPLETLDDAIDEVIACVADLYDLTEPLRYQVETVRRGAPKVGRNDPCPCGSGRKFKVCHGAA
jgi:uncharacterized protein